MGYTTQALSGFSWQTALKGGVMGLTLVKIMVLARLLSPQEFGLFSLVAITLGLTESLTQTGINITILQSQQPIRYFLDTAWVIAIVRGLVIAAVMVLLGLVMGRYYQEPALSSLVALAALVPIIKGFINPAIVSWQKNLQFFQDSLYRFSLAAVETVATLAIALLFPSVEALILGMVAAAVWEVSLSLWAFAERPTFRLVKERAWEILNNARGLTLTATGNYLIENLDDVIIGRTLGTTQLGLYHNGYALGHKVNYDFAKSLNHSVLPVFTRIVEDGARLKRAFWKTQGGFFALALVTSLPLLVFPELVVRLVLGEEWLAIVPVLPLLVVAGLLQSLAANGYSLLLATKRYGSLNAHLLLNLVLLVPLLLYLSQTQGLYGAGLGLVLARLLSLPVLCIGLARVFRHDR